jgi:hypothetical protein
MPAPGSGTAAAVAYGSIDAYGQYTSPALDHMFGRNRFHRDLESTMTAKQAVVECLAARAHMRRSLAARPHTQPLRSRLPPPVGGAADAAVDAV